MKKGLSYFVFCLFVAYGKADGTVYISAPEALKKAFPSATKLDQQRILLTEKQVKEIKDLQEGEPSMKDRLISYATAYKEKTVLGRAYFDRHIVRSKSETVMIALNGGGEILLIEILAFDEPQEYLSPEPWLHIFQGKSFLTRERLKREVPLITGATLTSKAILRTTKKYLAIVRVIHKSSHR